MSGNQLRDETSPYLLQHKDNPVHWLPWGAHALARAKREDKPILLSVGYAACHWCHVMAHESFEDPEIAALMNELFVNIKVDREERPDIDTVYQTALQSLGQPGGWPLTMFLAPDGAPFWGGTYFPPANRYGRPGFPDVLRRVHEVYRTEPETVRRNRDALAERLAALARSAPDPATVTEAILDEVANRLAKEIDPVSGGLGDGPKFPQCPILELLWRAYLRTGRPELRKAVTLTLDTMCQGGLYDHVGGGFARYTVDGRWLVPHFEKMLYDNAALVALLTLVWQKTRSPLYEARIRETVAWLLREMRTPPDARGRAAFASSLDADSDGREGAFYVWAEDKIDRLLGAEAHLFKSVYDISPAGNWEGTSIPNRLGQMAMLAPETEDRLARARAVLREARAARPRPGRDDKALTDWNGLAIAALARAGAVFEEPDWIGAAREAYGFLRGDENRSGRLAHSHRAGRARYPGLLDDYAQMGRAALALYEAAGNEDYVADARTWIDVIDRHHWDPAEGGYFLTPDDSETVITRVKSVQDAAMPSGNGAALELLVRLYHLTGDGRYRERADRLVDAFSGELRRNFFPLATFLNATAAAMAPVELVIAGESDDPAARALLRAGLAVSEPNLIISWLAPGADLPGGHPAYGKTWLGDRATAYLCRENRCSPPLLDPEELTRSLEARERSAPDGSA